MGVAQDNVRNGLLRAMRAEDFALLADHLIQVELSARAILIHENRIIREVYFPESGVCSMVALTPDREMIEVGCLGREGSTNFVLEPGKDKVPIRTFVQVPGEGWKMEAGAFAQAVQASKTLLQLTTRWDQVKAITFAYTAMSHGNHTIPERLARWVLMLQDRVGDEFPAVHDFLASMLAVRRSGVTEAIHTLEYHGAVKASRGRIRVLDRDKLIELAAGSYGVPEAEYERTIGPFPRA